MSLRDSHSTSLHTRNQSHAAVFIILLQGNNHVLTNKSQSAQRLSDVGDVAPRLAFHFTRTRNQNHAAVFIILLQGNNHVVPFESQSAERLSYVGDVAPRLAFHFTHTRNQSHAAVFIIRLWGNNHVLTNKSQSAERLSYAGDFRQMSISLPQLSPSYVCRKNQRATYPIQTNSRLELRPMPARQTLQSGSC